MNPWGTMNDWQRFEVDERIRRYGSTRRPARVARAALIPAGLTITEAVPQETPALSRDDVAACA